ncbi:MAG: methanol oxidation system protein MoxJ [Methylomicrobium sp.]|nr:methanol oxidation system protein MoxJ [Methylomicrobium sp.]
MKIQFFVLSAGLFLMAGCGSQTVMAEQQTLKVCNAENEMPYANKKGEGFENKLAEIIADELERKVEWVTWTDPRYLVRDYLDKGLCDVVIGMDAGDPRVLTTKPYYRSGYVFITRANDTPAVDQWDSEVLQKAERIAFVPGTPPEVMMRAIGRYNDMFNYMQELVGFKSRRNEYIKYETDKLVSEVSSGKAEVAALWGPAAARYVKASATPLTMSLIPDNNTRADGEKVGFHYSTSMAVRKDDQALLTKLDKALENRMDDITQTLKAEGIPLVEEPDQVLVSK